MKEKISLLGYARNGGAVVGDLHRGEHGSGKAAIVLTTLRVAIALVIVAALGACATGTLAPEAAHQSAPVVEPTAIVPISFFDIRLTPLVPPVKNPGEYLAQALIANTWDQYGYGVTGPSEEFGIGER